jgi:hypothetical protein
MSENGGKVWYIPDCFYNSKSNGLFPSHEAICVINPGKRDAEIDITLYFEDREPVAGFKAVCKAERTNHIRMDMLVSINGEKVPQDVPYAVKVVSNTEIIVQYSRMDTSQSEMALMTTIGYKSGY